MVGRSFLCQKTTHTFSTLIALLKRSIKQKNCITNRHSVFVHNQKKECCFLYSEHTCHVLIIILDKRINPIEVIGITTVLMIYPTPKKQTMDCIVDPKSDNKKKQYF